MQYLELDCDPWREQGFIDDADVMATAPVSGLAICRDWIRANLTDHTGVVDIVTVGECIISVHLRAADQ